MNPTNANKTLFNTDYPIDKLVYYVDTSFTVAAHHTDDKQIGIPVLLDNLYLIGLWSTDPTFATASSFSGAPSTAGSLQDLYVSTLFLTDGSQNNVVFNCNNDSGSSVTFYIRAWGYLSEDSVSDTPFTSNVGSDNFNINTDYNYLKLFKDGITPPITTPFTFNHNLGYIPLVNVWWMLNFSGSTQVIRQNSSSPALSAFYSGIGKGVHISSTTLTIFPESSITATQYYYRVYLDRML